MKPPQSILEDYDRWHEKMRMVDGTDSPLKHPWYESVYRELKSYPGGRLLEVGCGRGGFAIWLAKNAPQFEIVGLDFSGAAIAIAKDSAAQQNAKVEFVQGDAEKLQFVDNSFDVVISCECMEHVPEPRKMADELARVAKPGGKICLTTPSQLNGMSIAWLHSRLTRRPYNSGAGVQPRENFFFFWMVRGYLREAGLVVERMESCHYQWLLLPRVAPNKLCTKQFKSCWARSLAFPFGLHFSFFAHKPNLNLFTRL